VPAARVRASALGLSLVDTPAEVAAAKTASLTFFVGGEAATLGRIRPLLELMGKAIFHIGPSGTGQVTKLANQIAQLANLQSTAEALLFADT
jgi:3-hydroxyisobutyrate dehydrogenase-like beta-hydroxyacid dehydrogenase